MIIKNGLVYNENFEFEKKDLYIDNDKITSKLPEDSEVIDAEGLYVVPGFIDVHTHGAVGHDFCEASLEGLYAVSAFEKSRGITSYCPTSMTYSEEILTDVFKVINDFKYEDKYARVLGINMEGPFISMAKKGAQNPRYVQNSDIDFFRRLNKVCNNKIKLITLAPETDGADRFIKELSDEVSISVGHTTADYDTASSAFDNGAKHVTHLFNAMPLFAHRDPGVVGAALEHKNVMAEVICDKIHVHPAMIRSIYRMFGKDRIVLISDSMEATGMEDGTYSLGGQQVTKSGSKATLSDGTLAGSVTDLFTCFKNAVDIGIPLEDAVKMASYNPAKSIGMEDQVGLLKEGYYADILLLDKDLNLVRVI